MYFFLFQTYCFNSFFHIWYLILVFFCCCRLHFYHTLIFSPLISPLLVYLQISFFISIFFFFLLQTLCKTWGVKRWKGGKGSLMGRESESDSLLLVNIKIPNPHTHKTLFKSSFLFPFVVVVFFFPTLSIRSLQAADLQHCNTHPAPGDGRLSTVTTSKFQRRRQSRWNNRAHLSSDLFGLKLLQPICLRRSEKSETCMEKKQHLKCFIVFFLFLVWKVIMAMRKMGLCVTVFNVFARQCKAQS